MWRNAKLKLSHTECCKHNSYYPVQIRHLSLPKKSVIWHQLPVQNWWIVFGTLYHNLCCRLALLHFIIDIYEIMDTQKLIWQAFSGIVLSRSIETIAACNIWFRGKLLDVSFLCPIEILEHVWMRNTSIVVGGHEICGGLFYPVVVLIPIGWAAPVRPRKNVIFGSFQRQACLFFHVGRLE